MPYITCKCGNLVESKKRHDVDKLPCPECRLKEEKIQEKKHIILM